MRGKWAAAWAAFLLSVSACAALQSNNPGATPSPVQSQAPSPSPTPTAPPAIGAVSFPYGETGIEYDGVKLSVTGGVAPYQWSVGSGALPAGLTLGDDGSVSGTPGSAGTFGFTVQVADAMGAKAALARKIAVVPHVNADLIDPCATYCNVEIGCSTVCGPFAKVTGGAGPYTYRVTSGSLPAGTGLSATALNLTGTFGGQPGYLQFTAQVTDGFGATASVSPTFFMYKHIAWGGTYLCGGDFVSPCGVSIPYSGGLPGGRPTVRVVSVGAYCPTPPYCQPAPTAPPGTFTAVAGAVTARGAQSGGTVAISVQGDCGGGPNGCPNGYDGALTLQLVDQAPCTPTARCLSGMITVDVHISPG